MRTLYDIQNKTLDIPLNKEQYSSEINRTNPTAIVIMIDQSGSMGFVDVLYKGELKKYSVVVADMVNQTLNELIGRCTKAEGVRNYFDVCIIGYGANGKEANVIWEGNLKGQDWVTITDLKTNAKFIDKTVVTKIRGKEKQTVKSVPYWFLPVSNNLTPMGNAFVQVYDLLFNWIDKHQNSYPPTIINITDGMQSDVSDDDLIKITDKIKDLNTKDGHALILNCHISDNKNQVQFPLDEKELLGLSHSSLLYKTASVMPMNYNAEISRLRNDNDIYNNYKGMAFNASMDTLFNLIDIGTTGVTRQLNTL